MAKPSADKHVSGGRQARSEGLTQAWYHGAWWLYLLAPLSLIYFLVSSLRRALYRNGIQSSYRSSKPVIVVGNIALGGTGKSPLTSALVKSLQEHGYRPGIASRGYGADIPSDEVREVELTSKITDVGDEPLMLKRMLSCPVYVSPSRKLAVQSLEARGCDVILCDDGLQHYALHRDIELCVFDGQRGVGNGMVLPAGPLREIPSRVLQCEFMIVNGADKIASIEHPRCYRMDLQGNEFKALNPCLDKTSIKNDRVKRKDEFSGVKVHAVAAIGNPERFFNMLADWGIEVIGHAFEDHHHFQVEDFEFEESLPIIMTEKDAVKCAELGLQNAWYVPVDAYIDDAFFNALIEQLSRLKVQ